MDKKMIVFDLSTGGNGFVKYASAIVENLNDVGVYVRSESRSILPKKVSGETAVFKSYENGKQFIYKSLTILPVILLKVFILRIKGRFSYAYFPYFNHWNIPIMLVLRSMGVSVTYTSHDGKMHLGEKLGFTQFSMNMNIFLAQKIIFLSHATKQEVQHLLNGKNVAIIPHGLFEISGVNDLNEIRIKPTLLFIGRISPYKGIELLCKAVQRLDQSSFEKLIIAGKSNYQVVVPAHSKIILDDRWLREDEIADFINQSDIMVFPYLEATQSGALTIGITSARPIVLTDVGGMKEQLSVDEACFVSPNVESMYCGLSKLIGDISLRQKMVDKLRLKRQQWSWLNIAELVSQEIFR